MSGRGFLYHWPHSSRYPFDRFTGQPVVLGLAPASIVLLAVTLVLSTITFCGPPTTILEGAVHLVLFFVYVVLIFSP